MFAKNYADGRISAFLRVVDAWVQGIETGNATIPSLQEGVYSQILMDLSHQSHNTASWVDVPDLTAYLPN